MEVPELRMEVPEKTNTRLLNKHYSPMIVRKYQQFGWPMFVSLICDISLSDLDEVVNEYIKEVGEPKEDIQVMRNFAGGLSDRIIKRYEAEKTGCVEGCAVIMYVDKLFISSCHGDLMTHTKCAIELYSILNMMPHI